MSDTERQYPDSFSILEQARQGIITRWNEMRTYDTDAHMLKMKLTAIYAELSFLMRPEERDEILQQFNPDKTEEGNSTPKPKRLTKIIELMSPIYYERVVSIRWDLIAGTSQGFGEAAKASQQSLLNIFWGLDVASIQHVYMFIKKLEMILMNESQFDKIFSDVTHMLERWEFDWGNFPIGMKKAVEIPDIQVTKSGPESNFERAYFARDPDLDRTGVSNLDFNMHDYRMQGMTYFKEFIDKIQTAMPLQVEDESELRDKDGKLKEESYQLLFKAYKTRPNLRDLLFGSPLQLIPYRKTREYQLALRQLHFILMKTMVLLHDCEVFILRYFIPYEEGGVVASTSTYQPRQRPPRGQ